MKKKRAILSTGVWANNQKRGPIREAETGAEAHSKAAIDLEKLEKHYRSTGSIISESDALLWNGNTDRIFG